MAFNYNYTPANLLGGFQAGLDIRNQMQQMRMQEDAIKQQQAQQQAQQLQKQQVAGLSQGVVSEGVGGQSFKALAAIDPKKASAIKQALKTDDQGAQAAFEDAQMARSLYSLDPSGAATANFLSNRVQTGLSMGRDMSDTAELLRVAQSDPAQAVASLDSFLGTFKPDTGASTASVQDFEYWQQLKKTDPEAAKQFGRQAGFDRMTKEEEADLKVQTTGRTETAKGISKRMQGYIDSGIDAADSTANLRRSIDLLDRVSTGGFDNVALAAKNLLGITGADEGELSANMGKAVLAQLKPIFGAAFTAAEGERLEKIEAGFGRSAEVNKRLLKNALTIAERSSRRGLSAAKKAGDDFTAAEIENALNFEFNPDELVKPAQQAGKANVRSESDILAEYGL